MVRKLSIAVAAALFTATTYAQGPMHDTWDINAPNGAPMILGQPLPAAPAAAPVARGPMHDTWDINAPNGEPSALAATPATDAHVHGIATNARVDRVITVKPGTRHVNVRSGETVRFEVGGQSFVRTFEPTVNHPSFELSEIAPAGLDVQGVRVYCSPDQYERAA